jgi:methyl-accepting chemotaxis protein
MENTVHTSKKIVAVHDFEPAPEQIAEIKEGLFGKIDRGMDYVVFVQFVVGVVLAHYTQTWYTAIGMGVISLAIYCTFRFLFTGLAVLRYLIGIVLSMFVVQYLFQLHGAIYVQQLFVVTMTLMLFYQNWRSLVPSFLLITLYFVAIFYVLNTHDATITIFFSELLEYDLWTIVYSFIFLSMQFMICFIIALQLERRFNNSIRNTIYINEQLNLEANIELANQIAMGNFDGEYQLRRNDYMGATLLSMRTNLKNYREQESRNHWINEGIAKISQVLMLHSDLNDLSNETLIHVCKYIRASQGLLFTTETDDKDKGQKLLLRAAYAYEDVNKVGQYFEIGDDLVGEAVLRKHTIHLNNLPANYLRVSSGLGTSTPFEVVLVPLCVQDEVIGVLELSTLNKFQPIDIEFLEKIGERVATSLLTVQANQRNNELLKEAQLLTEQLKTQEDFLRQNMEDLGKAQAAMTEANAKLDRLLRNVPGMIFAQANQQGKWAMEFVSEGARQLTGYAPQQIQSGEVAFVSLIHPEDLKTTYQEADKQVAKALQEKQSYDIEYRIIDANKQIKWIKEKGNGLYDQEGNLIGLQGFLTDITAEVIANSKMQEQRGLLEEQLEEMKAQEELIKSTLNDMEQFRKELSEKNTELQNTLKAIDEVLAIVELSPDRKVIHVNEKFCEISNYAPEEIVGKDLAFYVPQEDIEKIDALWQEVLKGKAMTTEICRIRKDGSRFWLHAHYIPTLDAKGKLIKISTMSTDITTQKLKEIEIQRSLGK